MKFVESDSNSGDSPTRSNKHSEHGQNNPMEPDIEQGLSWTPLRMTTNANPRNVTCIKRLIPWMITLSGICICAVSFVLLLQGPQWQLGNDGASSSEKYESGEQSPFRILLSDLTDNRDSIQAHESAKDIPMYQSQDAESQSAFKALAVDSQRGESDSDLKLASNLLLSVVQMMMSSSGSVDKEDKQWIEMYPEIDRPASPVARDQGREPICWMFAAASLLRTKQRFPTPHKNLVDEMKKIERGFRGFWERLKKQYDEDKVQGMKYWMQSEWWKLTQSPDMKKAFPYDWTNHILKDSFLSHDRDSQHLMLQKFWNLHGFSFVEIFYSNSGIHDQETMIKEKLQNERALIVMSGRSFQTVIRELPDLLPAGNHGPWHMMMLDTFKSNTKTGEYIVKNSLGTTGGSRGARDGKFRISGEVLNKLEYIIYFIGKTHSIKTLEQNGWMWAVATVSQTKQGNRYPIQELVAEVKEQWYTFLAFSSERERIKIQSGHWSTEQEQYWRRTGWWDWDFAESREIQIEVADKFYESKGLQLSKTLNFWSRPKPITLMKKLFQEGERQVALITFSPPSWRKMISKFTDFHETNGDGSDLGGTQLMILQGFFQNERDEGFYMLQDTHGLNKGSIIQIPEEQLYAMVFVVWFVENRPLPDSEDVHNQGNENVGSDPDLDQVSSQI